MPHHFSPSERHPAFLPSVSDWWAPAALLGLAALGMRQDGLLFHTLVELFAIMVAVVSAVIAWHTYGFSRNNYLMYLTAGYFWVGAVDLAHALTYPGMSVYPYDTSEQALQFWLGARSLQAITLLSAPLFLLHGLERRTAFAVFGTVSGLLYMAVMNGYFPQVLGEAGGMTSFALISEYTIIGLLVAAFVHLWHRKGRLDSEMARLMRIVVVLTAIAEVGFIVSAQKGGLYTLINHGIKLFSFWALFLAVVRTGLREPFRILAGVASTYDAIPDATVVVDATGVIRQTNKAARSLVGLSEKACFGRHCHDLFHPSQWLKSTCPICQCIEQGRPVGAVEVQSNERKRWYSISLSPFGFQDGVQGMVHVVRDVTERRQAEEALRRDQARLAEAQRIAMLGSWEWDIQRDVVEWSEELLRIFGLTSECAPATRAAFLERIHPEERESVGKSIEAALRDGAPYLMEYRAILADGQIRYIRGKGRLERDAEGRPARMLGIAQDVTERKLAENALRRSEERFRNLVETTSDWVWEVDECGRYTYVSPQIRDILGYEPAEVLGRTPFDLMRPAEAKRVGEQFAALLADCLPIVALENVNLSKEGRGVVLETSGVPFYDADGRLRGYRGIDRDITERKRAEQILHASERRYRTLVDNLPLSVFLKDCDSVYVSCNHNYARELGIPSSQIEGRRDEDFYPALLAEKYRIEDLDVMASGRRLDVEETWVKDGKEVSIRTLKVPVTNEAGAVIGVLGIFWDITEQKQAQEVLRMSEARYRAIVEDQTELLIRFLPDGRLTFVNEAFARYLGTESQQLVGRSFFSFVAEEQRGRIGDDLMQFSHDYPVGTLEFKIQMPAGTARVLQWTSRAICDEQGQVVEFQATGRDITERNRTEKELRRALEEKEALLREVHHRVKNNMQVISSLLGLEVRRLTDPQAVALFRDAENRIRSMSLVHERLYRCRDLSRIDFVNYVRDVVSHLARVYPTGAKVDFLFEIEDLPIALDRAIPYGLVINELVSNALKHAFPDEREGCVRIAMKRGDAGTIELTVADNGVGLPAAGPVSRPDTLGLKLVSQLVERQLHGRLEVSHEEGTLWRMTFICEKEATARVGND